MSRKHLTGLGFNPAFLDGTLPWPKDCTYLEAGTNIMFDPSRLHAVESLASFTSLHLARAPMCEPEEVQERFLAYLWKKLPQSVKSVGLHLCGSYSVDLGLFGFGTAFKPTPLNREACERFVGSLCREAVRRGVEVLLENANFYEASAAEAMETVNFLNGLCHRHSAGLILDVAHLRMAACNVGLPAELLLGRVDLTLLTVLHLSGCKTDANGTLHDAHDVAVSPDHWSLARLALSLTTRSVRVVLEHTDPQWGGHAAEFLQDYNCLRQLLDTIDVVANKQHDVEAIATDLMLHVVLPQRLASLRAYLGETKFTSAVRTWAKSFLPHMRQLSQQGTYCILRPTDWYVQPPRTVDPVADFVQFLRAAESGEPGC
jgi:hypothetical protein